MDHWTPPTKRGLYSGASHNPPYPQPAHSNDLGSRLARMEVHIYHETMDRRRIEDESLRRGMDLASALRGIEGRLSLIETNIGAAKTFAKWLPAVLKYAGATVLFFLLLSGKLTQDGAKMFLAVLGLPTG